MLSVQTIVKIHISGSVSCLFEACINSPVCILYREENSNIFSNITFLFFHYCGFVGYSVARE